MDVHKIILCRLGATTLAGLVLALTLTGCETAAQRLDPKAVATIKPGITTRAEVLQAFGTPRQTLSGQGRTLLIYERDYAATLGGFGPTQPATVVGLSVLLNEHDRVIRTLRSEHKVDVRAGAGVISAGAMITRKELSQIQPGTTTRRDAIALLGGPAREELMLDGRVVLSWLYQEANVVGGGRSRYLQLVFDDKDVVVASQTEQYP